MPPVQALFSLPITHILNFLIQADSFSLISPLITEGPFEPLKTGVCIMQNDVGLGGLLASSIRRKSYHSLRQIALNGPLLAAVLIVGGLGSVARAQATPHLSPVGPTGQANTLDAQTGTIAFAGQEITLSGATGLIGMSSEVAYGAVSQGIATADGKVARAGQMLLIPPYGAAVSVQHFDASRLLASLDPQTRTALPSLAAHLTAIKAGQQRGIWLGRLGRTNYNVAAPGTGDAELAARTVTGVPAVQTIRYSGEANPATISQKVVDTFLGALARGDAATAASLLDPVPYGTSDLRGGASDARLMMARELIAQHPWATLLKDSAATRSEEDNVWKIAAPLGQGELVMRPMGDFIFVRSINVGEI
jgi:hypothetical protein